MSRRSRDELRTLMIDAGCELVAERGLAFDPPTLNYATVFDHLAATRGIRLHRSQVHGRIWNSQEDFRIEVVTSTIANLKPGSKAVDELVDQLGQPEADASHDRPPHDRPETGLGSSADGATTSDSTDRSRRQVAEDWVYKAIEASRTGAALDRGFDLFVAAQALSTLGSATADEIRAASRKNLGERMERNEERFRELTARLGATVDERAGVSPDDAFSLLARNSSALLEGIRMLEVVDSDLGHPFDVIDSTGTRQTRDIASLGLSWFVDELLDLSDDPEPGS